MDFDNTPHIQSVCNLIKDLGEDPTRNGLLKSPERFIKAMRSLTSGYHQDVEAILTEALFDVDYQDMVTIRGIEFYSLCEHHFLPFFGKVHVGYIPKDKVVGLSKIPRAIEVFARRLQVQERMTRQVAESIYDILGCEGVGVVVEAHHMCMMMRGVEKQQSMTITSSMHGCFKRQETRQEFLRLIHSERGL